MQRPDHRQREDKHSNASDNVGYGHEACKLYHVDTPTLRCLVPIVRNRGALKDRTTD